MTSDEGPWGSSSLPRRAPRPARAAQIGRIGLWLCFAAGLAGVVLALAHAYPEAVRTRAEWTEVAYRAGFVLVVCAGVFRAGLGVRPQHLRHLALWALLAAALALGFAYRAELAGVGEHLRLAFSAGDPVATGAHEVVVPRDADGSFVVVGQVNGQRVRFLVDTGASETVLSPDDARRIGVDVDRLRFVAAGETANGVGYGAPYVAPRLAVGPIAFQDFRVLVNKTPMSSSLLGMSFLDRLAAFQVEGDKLILKWREPAANAGQPRRSAAG
jgi:aspartyl protease family protein